MSKPPKDKEWKEKSYQIESTQWKIRMILDVCIKSWLLVSKKGYNGQFGRCFNLTKCNGSMSHCATFECFWNQVLGSSSVSSPFFLVWNCFLVTFDYKKNKKTMADYKSILKKKTIDEFRTINSWIIYLNFYIALNAPRQV